MNRIYAIPRRRSRPSPLPSPRVGWYVLVAIGGALVALGVYAYSLQLAHGDIVTGMRDPGRGGAAWGLYISLYVYLVGVSFAGITVASIARLFKLHVLEPVTRLAELLTITALVAGAVAVLADLGRVDHGLRSLPELARPSSPFYGTFTLVVAGYLFSSVVAFFVTGRRDAARMVQDGPRALRWFYRLWASGYRFTAEEDARHGRTTFWLALAILPLLVVAHSTLGFIFGLQAGRPGWYSALQAPAFIVLAGASGIGMLILAALALRRMLGLRIPDPTIHWLGGFLWVLCLVYLYFMIVEELTATYAGPALERHVAHAIVTGQFSSSFLVVVGCLFVGFAIPFVGYLRAKPSVGGIAIAATAVNVGALVKRLLIVVPSQTDGSYLALEPGRYKPSWIEWSVLAGVASLVLLMILVFARVFPLVHGEEPDLDRDAPLPREPVRKLACVAWAIVALALVFVGLTDSFRLWSGDELDPRLPFAPALFATGVMMLFATAIVYEVLPSRRRRKRSPRVVDRARSHVSPPCAALAAPIRATERRTTSSPGSQP
ncbi:MAG TPA: NrfD/PsrC family molybdoenzyme membrane anchor subunit [Kofleriaceae bacterium]|nr:NrfD/PsrC family molybdoenzyme membrane anchor subunit [Kofleriaceae bacterium]